MSRLRTLATIVASGAVSLVLAACAASGTPATTAGPGGVTIQSPVELTVGTTAAPDLLIGQARLAADAGAKAAQSSSAVKALPMTGEVCAGK